MKYPYVFGRVVVFLTVKHKEVLSGKFFSHLVLVYFVEYIYKYTYTFIQIIFILIYSILGPGLDTGDIVFVLPIVRGLVLNQL